MKNQKHIDAYQNLFNHMNEEHGLILLESEMDEIIKLSLEAVKKFDENVEQKI